MPMLEHPLIVEPCVGIAGLPLERPPQLAERSVPIAMPGPQRAQVVARDLSGRTRRAGESLEPRLRLVGSPEPRPRRREIDLNRGRRTVARADLVERFG